MPAERLRVITDALGDFPTRIRVGALALLVSVALLTNVMNFVAVLRHDARPNIEDEVERHEARLEGLRRELPRRGVVGYLTDATDPNEATKRYYMTQYALAPLLVVRGAERELVVGDFKDPSAEVGESVGAGLVLRKDFGDGVRLFGKEGR